METSSKDGMQLEPGTVLAEKYRLESVLGTGGMGTVYRAEHLALKAPVAIKVIDREVDEGDVALARFMREAQSAASLRSPHVVQILDYGTDGSRPFMVMEMLEGEPLADRIDRVGQLSPEATYRVISHVAKAVAKAHEADIIHRDLKPDNVFLVHNEGDEIAKVLDFGVAKVETTALDGEGHTRTGSLLGTPFYMSPEQAQGNKDIDARSDLWALGVIAFECLTGKRPFSSDGLGDLVLQICIRDIPRPSDFGKVPKGFDDWFFKACEREPADRFQTARELSEGLRTALSLGDMASIPESRWSAAASLPQKKPAARNPETLTTQPDPEKDEVPQSQRPTAVNRSEDARAALASETLMEGTAPGDRQAAKGEKAAREGSQWEVVPHGEEEAPVAAVTHDSSGGTSIGFVAVTALLLGGAIVFGMKQAGVEVFGAEPEEQPRLSTPQPKKATPATSNTPTKKKPAKKKPTKKTALKDQPSDPSAEEGSADGQEQSDDGAETGNEEPTEGAKEDGVDEGAEGEEKPAVGDKLDAIEDAAAKAIEERDKQDEAEAPQEQPKKDEPSGPQPTLPAGLTPAPAPPPAAP